MTVSYTRLVRSAIIALTTLVPAVAQAQIVAPSSAVTEGNGANFSVFSNGSSVTQTMLDSSLLSPLQAGNQITGISFRLDGIATTGSPALNFADFDIFLGQGVAVTAGSSTFADNYTAGGPRTQVRNGALLFAAGAFAGSASAGPEAFGPTITFDTPYTYQGGPLILEIRQSGNGAGIPTRLDGVTPFSNSPYRTFTNSPSDALGGVSVDTPVVQFAVTAGAAPEPSSGILFGMLGLVTVAGTTTAQRYRRR